MKVLEMVQEKITKFQNDSFHLRSAKAFSQTIQKVIINNECQITKGTIKKFDLDMNEINELIEQKLLKYTYSSTWRAKQLGQDDIWSPTAKFIKQIEKMYKEV